MARYLLHDFRWAWGARKSATIARLHYEAATEEETTSIRKTIAFGSWRISPVVRAIAIIIRGLPIRWNAGESGWADTPG